MEDTPVPQKIILSEVDEYIGTVEIFFLEAYEGTKYKDLCINFIARQRIKNDKDFFESFAIINKELAKKNCYVRILPMFYEKWRPEKTYGGCPIESTFLFQHSHCEDFIEEDGDSIAVKKVLYEKYIFPEFEKLNYAIENLTYTQYGDAIIETTFEINSTMYCMKAWIYTEDYLLITFDCI